MSLHVPVVEKSLREHSKTASWLSPAIQNELIHFLSDQVRFKIKQELQEAVFFTIRAMRQKTSVSENRSR